MATTYTLISSNVLTSSAASVTFSSIPATYTDLVLKVSGRTDRASNVNNGLTIQFSSDTGTNYGHTYIRGDGSTVTSSGDAGNVKMVFNSTGLTGATATTSTYGSIDIYIPNYTASTIKPLSFFGAGETNATSVNMGAFAGLWNNTSAITSILISREFSSNFLSDSSFYLYGIKNS